MLLLRTLQADRNQKQQTWNVFSSHAYPLLHRKAGMRNGGYKLYMFRGSLRGPESLLPSSDRPSEQPMSVPPRDADSRKI